MKTLNPYIELYKQCKTSILSKSSDLLNSFRNEQVLENVDKYFFKEEYTTDYGININRVNFSGDPFTLYTCNVPGITSHNCVVLNDTFYSKISDLPVGVIICSISEAIQIVPKLVEKYYCKIINESSTEILLNNLFNQDGLFVYIPKNVKLDKPIQLVNLMSANSDMMGFSHNLIILEEGAHAQLLVCDHVNGNNKYFANRITEVYVGENATYEHYKLESTSDNNINVNQLFINQQSSSNVLTNVITLTNGKTHNNINVSLNGSEANLSLNGLGLADKTQNVLNTTKITHNTPNSTSKELFKYILDDNSYGEFLGLIKVVPGADKTIALQTNRNICLSKEARIKTLPQLEIYADDVKCNHGATVGQLDETALFYMQSRGLSKKDAKLLLMYAFVHDVLDNVSIPALKDRLQILIEKRLRKELPQCKGCNICK